jgi:hypothetical protein
MQSKRAIRLRQRRAALAADSSPWDIKPPEPEAECVACKAGYERRYVRPYGFLHYISDGFAGVCTRRDETTP